MQHEITAFEGNTAIVSFKDYNITAYVDRIHDEHSRGICGQVTFKILNGTDELVIGRNNLYFSSVTSRETFAKSLSSNSIDGLSSKDYQNMVNWLSVEVEDKFREGEPIQEFMTDEDVPAPAYLIEPIIYENSPTVMFGDGGSGKSTLAQALLIVAQLPYFDNSLGLVAPSKSYSTLFLDYETEKSIFAYRLNCLVNGFDLPPFPIKYLRCDQSLPDMVESLKQKIIRENINFIIIDSLGLAAGGNLNEDKTAIQYYKALRQLKCSSLSIAHTSKDLLTKNKSIFGSVFFRNLARSVWELKSSKETNNANELTIGLFQDKTNFSKKHSPLGFKFTFDDVNRRYTLETASLSETELQPELPFWMQLKDIVIRQPMLIKELADETGKSEENVRTTVNRHPSIFTKLADKRIGIKDV